MTATPFTISELQSPTGVLMLSLAGEFDMSVGDALARPLLEAARAPDITTVVVDLEQTRLIDSHAIAGLVAGYQAAIAAGRGFTVINAHDAVRQVLDITGLSEILIERSQ